MTPTETAIRAFVAVLTTAAAVPGAKFPAPLRNDDLPSRLVDAGSKLSLYVNVMDGDRGNSDELLGADLGNTSAYELNQHVRVELAVAGGSNDDRETRFDDARKAIWDALKPTLSGSNPTYLGGAVNGLMLIDIVPQANTVVAGLPNVKACEFVFALEFTSSDPF